jgi:hypothetical protein
MPTQGEIASARAEILRRCSSAESQDEDVIFPATPAIEAAARTLRSEGLVEVYTRARTAPGVHELGMRLTDAGRAHVRSGGR